MQWVESVARSTRRKRDQCKVGRVSIPCPFGPGTNGLLLDGVKDLDLGLVAVQSPGGESLHARLDLRDLAGVTAAGCSRDLTEQGVGCALDDAPKGAALFLLVSGVELAFDALEVWAERTEARLICARHHG